MNFGVFVFGDASHQIGNAIGSTLVVLVIADVIQNLTVSVFQDFDMRCVKGNRGQIPVLAKAPKPAWVVRQER